MESNYVHIHIDVSMKDKKAFQCYYNPDYIKVEKSQQISKYQLFEYSANNQSIKSHFLPKATVNIQKPILIP